MIHVKNVGKEDKNTLEISNVSIFRTNLANFVNKLSIKFRTQNEIW